MTRASIGQKPQKTVLHRRVGEGSGKGLLSKSRGTFVVFQRLSNVGGFCSTATGAFKLRCMCSAHVRSLTRDVEEVNSGFKDYLN